MIRLVFAIDANCIIGDTDPDRNAQRFPLLPPALNGVMGELYTTRGAAIFGEPSLMQDRPPGLQNADIFCLTRNPEFNVPDVTAVSDVDAFAGRFKGSGTELLVLGGLTAFKLFLPYADEMDVALLDKPVPGDVGFPEWKSAPFSKISEEHWHGGRTLRIKRS